MTALIRTIDGRETPATGRWTIAPGQPVAGRAGRWPRRRDVNARTRSGGMLITETGDLAFRLRFDTASNDYCDSSSLTYQSISIDALPGDGLWSVAGELIADGQLTPARSLLIYHGVFRSGPGAIAWLGWHLRVPVLRAPCLGAEPGMTRRLALSADLNADAPPDLTLFLPHHSPRRAHQP